ncbi:hypothetical protein ACSHWB_07895 [Lentzea sp. HUAS TT2]|uniref:hypothetical protein n=1 Tax=Lentzea sp. HUAS TT2 TaxID=3447454 RepID=UPI003F6FFDCC
MPRSWNEIDQDEDRPDFVELVNSRKSFAWEQVPLAEPALDRYLEQVAATHVNGGHLVSRWRAVEYSDTAAWFLARQRIDDYGLLRVFFGDDAVREGLSELQVPPSPDTSSLGQEWAGTLCLDGTLAGVIVLGGAYKTYEGPVHEAKALAVGAVEALMQSRYEQFTLHTSRAPWTPWFHDVAWDHTYVLTDFGNAEITVLCITDTD